MGQYLEGFEPVCELHFGTEAMSTPSLAERFLRGAPDEPDQRCCDCGAMKPAGAFAFSIQSATTRYGKRLGRLTVCKACRRKRDKYQNGRRK